MVVNIPNGENVQMEQNAETIKRIAARIASPSRMQGRTVAMEMERMISNAQQIIEAAEAIRAANPGK